MLDRTSKWLGFMDVHLVSLGHRCTAGNSGPIDLPSSTALGQIPALEDPTKRLCISPKRSFRLEGLPRRLRSPTAFLVSSRFGLLDVILCYYK